MKLDFRSLEKVGHRISKKDIQYYQKYLNSAVCKCYAIDNKHVSHMPLIAELTTAAWP